VDGDSLSFLSKASFVIRGAVRDQLLGFVSRVNTAHHSTPLVDQDSRVIFAFTITLLPTAASARRGQQWRFLG